MPERLDSEAEKARIAGENDSLWRSYFVRQAKITSDSDLILRETASRFLSEIAPLDKQARSIIQEIRAKNPQPLDWKADGTPTDKLPLPVELSNLQNQKDEIVLRNRDSFRSAIGEDEFAKFSEFLVTEFSKGFVRHEINPDEQIPQPEGEDNGFKPFESNENGGNQ